MNYKGIYFSANEKVYNWTLALLRSFRVFNPELEFLKAKFQEVGLLEHIHFLGYIDEVLKYSLLNLSKVFLMPNYDDSGGDFEGFGISFLEAGYYDNHVVAGHHGGAVEAMEFIDHYDLINVHNKTDLQLIVDKLNIVLRPNAH